MNPRAGDHTQAGREQWGPWAPEVGKDRELLDELPEILGTRQGDAAFEQAFWDHFFSTQ